MQTSLLTYVRTNQSVFFRSLRLLSLSDKRKYLAVGILQLFSALLDLGAVAFMGLLGSLAVSGVQSKNPGNKVSTVLKIIHIESFSFQIQVAFLSFGAVVLLVSKTLLSVFFTRRTLYFLSKKGADISGKMVTELLKKPITYINSKSSQETLYSLTEGVSAITVGILGTFMSMFADVSMLIILSSALFFIDPVTSFTAFTIFSFIGILLHRILSSKARNLGQENRQFTVKSSEKIVEILNSYREAFVRDNVENYAKTISEIRFNLARSIARLSFMPYIGKYVIESTVIIGGLLLGAFQFIYQDAMHAVATLAIFLTAGMRIAPAFMRTQQGLIAIKSNFGTAEPTLNFIKELNEVPSISLDQKIQRSNILEFNPKISFKDVSYYYSENSEFKMDNISFEIAPGSFLGIVGPSGSGKTTLVDLLIGVIKPVSGEINISGYKPAETIKRWPSSIGYVAQDVSIIDGSIVENVALGYKISNEIREEAMKIMSKIGFDSFVRNLPDGIDTQVGERGTRLSGGQKQRLGIARSLFSNPKLLILDEATSSLDGLSEYEITESINKLKGTVTLVVIAHRLSTIKNADKLIYIEKGKILDSGTFEELRKRLPQFSVQADLMEL